MPEHEDQRPTSLGIYDRQKDERITGIEVVATVLSVLWLLATAVFFLVLQPAGAFGGGALQFVLIMLVVFLPVAMIWVGAIAARASRVMREESRRLQTAIDAIRNAYVTENQNRNAAAEPSVEKKLDEIAAAQRKTETALAMFTSTRQPETARPPAPPAPEGSADDEQVALPLGTSADDIRPPLERSDFIRALNFPETADDREGFAALRKALKDRETAQLIQAAQDVLTLLSHDGIYMDDLRPDMARPEVWRRFADGERGRTMAALGGVRDRSSLALTASRMRQDAIFRDAAHHFLRLFDRMFSRFAETATDPEISELSDTRTARAFMLLGRVAGTFD
ncbi:hypothetical protein [Roseovarius sp. SYSU LYC5161]|uniref:hypothetical protein n=1 Tax=Roseovarius halophilus (ex Wu et al. 2025) TaxID=3376060 RepID=UPI0028722B0A|nr:hypothetical protein [Roseovarius sp.]